jgi:hypothetical protein
VPSFIRQKVASSSAFFVLWVLLRGIQFTFVKLTSIELIKPKVLSHIVLTSTEKCVTVFGSGKHVLASFIVKIIRLKCHEDLTFSSFDLVCIECHVAESFAEVMLISVVFYQYIYI